MLFSSLQVVSLLLVVVVAVCESSPQNSVGATREKRQTAAAPSKQATRTRKAQRTATQTQAIKTWPSEPPPQQNSSLGQLEPIDLAQAEVSRMFGYRNTPPVFILPRRDFYVDVAKLALGYKMATVQAIDQEGDRLEYSLEPSLKRDASQYFSINSTSGELRLANKRFPAQESEQPASGGYPEPTDDETSSSSPHDSDAESEAARQQVAGGGGSYFLNVVAFDGEYRSVIELQINVFNSSSLIGGATSAAKSASPVQLTNEAARRAAQTQTNELIMRSKTNEFFNRLLMLSPQTSPVAASNSTLVYPNFVNPSLTRPAAGEQLDAPLAADQRTLPARQRELATDAVQLSVLHEQQQAASTKPPATLADRSLDKQQPAAQLLPGSPPPPAAEPLSQQPLIVNLAIVICSTLTITLLLLVFVVPLSVKRIRKRLKTVELQHEQLSQKASSGCMSTMCSSSASSGGGHLPSLSQFTLSGSDQSCTSSGARQVCRQSSLDSAFTSIATPLPNAPVACPTVGQHNFVRQTNRLLVGGDHCAYLANGLNRVNNGSIANPVYLQQQQRADEPFGLAKAQPYMGQHQAHYLPPHSQPSLFGVEDVYTAPLNDNDEFYSTINDSVACGQSQHELGATGTLCGQTTESRAYLNSECAPSLVAVQPQQLPAQNFLHLQRTESPASSRSSTRSLTRFLSLPARHLSHQNNQQVDDNFQATGNKASHLDELEYNFGKQQQELAFYNAKTIARTAKVDLERQTARGGAAKTNSSSNWEIERHKLKFLEILDDGQFGLVWRCKLSLAPAAAAAAATYQADQTVAVKTLKKVATSERERDELLAEIEIMKSVCDHPNVVKILHCCTTNLSQSRPILLVMEFVEFGNLQSFLKGFRSNHNYATSPAYNNQLLTSRELVKFIYHIAKGMEYVSAKCIVHRDLASRNILVSSERVCKIGDFGMARHTQSLGDVYERRSRNTRIPVRWMAPEVLTKNKYTTKSDVFSFGILMWEVVTLGSTPYPHLDTNKVIAAVAENGERPSKPEHCHLELYNMMSKCWAFEPDERPTFGSIARKLDELLLSANEYIELDQYPDHIYTNISKTAAPHELL